MRLVVAMGFQILIGNLLFRMEIDEQNLEQIK